MNEIIENILTRRSIRSYKEEQVPEEALNTILQAGAYAPSGGNSQTWRFTAVQKPELLKALNDAVKQAYADYVVDENTYRSIVAGKKASQNPDFNFYYHAPTLIVVSNLASYSNAMADCACAIENMMLAAHALGLASCYINQLRWFGDMAAVREVLSTELQIPSDHVICGSFALGFNAGAQPKAQPRKDGVINIIK